MARRGAAGLHRRARDDAGRRLRRGAAAAGPGQRAGRRQPRRHADQPALQRRRSTGRAAALRPRAAARRPLPRLLVAGTLPGVVAGAIVRVELLSDEHAFLFVAAGVLLPLGLWLLLAGQRMQPRRREVTPRLRLGVLGHGADDRDRRRHLRGRRRPRCWRRCCWRSASAPMRPPPATLAATFLTSIAGIATYVVLQAAEQRRDRPRMDARPLPRRGRLRRQLSRRLVCSAACPRRRCGGCWA